MYFKEFHVIWRKTYYRIFYDEDAAEVVRVIERHNGSSTDLDLDEIPEELIEIINKLTNNASS